MARQEREEVPLNVEGRLDGTTKGVNEDDDDGAEYEWVPPDGGWGWLVLSGSVLVSLLIPGTIKTFGVILVEVLEIFNASQVAASGIPALTYFLYCSLGPLASYLSSRYSFRSVTLVGGLFAASGMILSRFATNVTHLYICYGILVGTGAGLSFPPGVFIVTSYFVRLRGLANGIAISGSALGSIILPPFLRFLLETYGYRGAVLIMGGLILNVLVGASLYDPVQQHLKRVRVDKTKKNGKQTEVMYIVENTEEEKRNGDINKPPEEKGLLENSTIYESGESPTENNIVNQYHSPPGKEQFSTEGNLDTVLKNGVSHLSLNRPIVNSESAQQISRKISTGSYRGRNPYVMGSMGQLTRKTSMSRPGCLPKVASATAMARKVSIGSNLSSSSFRYISTAFHGSTLVGLNHEFSSQANMKTAPAKEPRPSFFANLCGCCLRSKKLEPAKEHKEEGVYSKLLRDPVFIVILISNASTAIGYTNFTILLPMYAVKLGYDKNSASYLLSIVSSTDLVGRIGGSALSDWLPIKKKYYYIGGLLFSGISLVLLPHAQSYLSLGLFCAAFGLASGTYVGITAIIMVDLLGEERLASSYGVSLFINGIVQLVGPPICGFAYDYINSYNPIITALGLALIGGSAVWLYLPLTNRSEKRDNILA